MLVISLNICILGNYELFETQQTFYRTGSRSSCAIDDLYARFFYALS